MSAGETCGGCGEDLSCADCSPRMQKAKAAAIRAQREAERLRGLLDKVSGTPGRELMPDMVETERQLFELGEELKRVKAHEQVVKSARDKFAEEVVKLQGQVRCLEEASIPAPAGETSEPDTSGAVVSAARFEDLYVSHEQLLDEIKSAVADIAYNGGAALDRAVAQYPKVFKSVDNLKQLIRRVQ